MQRLVFAAAILVLALGLSAHSDASCMTPSALRSFDGSGDAGRSFIWAATLFDPLYFESYAPLSYDTPITSQLTGTFWATGRGDTAVGVGDDSGSLSLIGSGALAYAGNMAYQLFYAAELDADWSDPSVDGCIGPNSCSCLLLSDTDTAGRTGYFALIGTMSDAFGDTFFNLPGTDPIGHASPIILREIPRPTITSVNRPQMDTVEATVSVASRSSAVYEGLDGASCSCGPTGFLVYTQVVPRFATPPLGRAPGGWTLAPLAAGGAQSVTPTDTSVTLAATCAGADADVYFTTQLFFDSGFSTAVVSGNSMPIECGGNLSGPLARVRTGPQRPRGGKDR